MYGTGIGTGTSATLVATGMATGSYILMGIAAVALSMMLFTLIRNTRRRAAHQRP